MVDPEQSQACMDRCGFTNPPDLSIPCGCPKHDDENAKCTGNLRFEQEGLFRAFLVCTNCGCCYSIMKIDEKVHWPDCGANHGGACDMGPECGT